MQQVRKKSVKYSHNTTEKQNFDLTPRQATFCLYAILVAVFEVFQRNSTILPKTVENIQK